MRYPAFLERVVITERSVFLFIGMIGCILSGAAVPLLPFPVMILLIIGTAIVVLMHRYVTLLMYLLISLSLLGRTLLGFDFNTDWSNNGTIFPFYIPFLFPVLMVRNANGLSHANQIIKSMAFIPLMILLGLWSLLTLLWSDNKFHGILVELELIVNIAIFLFCIYDLTSKEKIYTVLKFWCFFAIFIGFLALARHFMTFGGPYDIEVELVNKVLIKGSIGETVSRAMGVSNPNASALIMNVSFYIAMGMAVFSNRFTQKCLAFFMGIFFLFIMLLTGSKGGMVSLIFSFSLVLLIYTPFRKGIVYYTLGSFALFLILMALVVVSSPDNRVTGALTANTQKVSNDETSFGSRLQMWEDGFTSLLNESYGLGLGPGGFTHHCSPHPHSHSLYFSVLFDFGFVGFLFMIALFISIARNFQIPLKDQSKRLHAMAVFLGGGLLAMAFHCLIDHMYSRTILWLYLGLVVSTLIVCASEDSEERSTNASGPGITDLSDNRN